MRYLIDTHVLIWASYGLKPLPEKAASILANAGNDVFVSIASLWEIAIKASLGKLDIDMTLFGKLEDYNYSMLPVNIAHLHTLAALPHHHRDPFDRMIIAQAQCEKLAILTHDRHFEAYEAKVTLV